MRRCSPNGGVGINIPSIAVLVRLGRVELLSKDVKSKLLQK